MVDGPLAHGRPLSQSPDEAAVEPPGVPALSLCVPGGDDVVEAQGIGQGGDEIQGRRGGQHDPEALGSVGLEGFEGPGLDQVDEGLDGALAGPAGGVGRPAPHVPGGGPGQPDGGQRLPEPVVEPVQEALAGDVAPFAEDPLGHHGLLHHGPAGRPEECAVEIDEHRTGLRSHATRYRPTSGSGRASWPGDRLVPAGSDVTPGPGRRGRSVPGRGKGTARGGRRSLRTDSTR